MWNSLYFTSLFIYSNIDKRLDKGPLVCRNEVGRQNALVGTKLRWAVIVDYNFGWSPSYPDHYHFSEFLWPAVSLSHFLMSWGKRKKKRECPLTWVDFKARFSQNLRLCHSCPGSNSFCRPDPTCRKPDHVTKTVHVINITLHLFLKSEWHDQNHQSSGPWAMNEKDRVELTNVIHLTVG